MPYIGYSVNSVTYKASGNSAYDALQVHAEQRMRWGLRFGASYTYAHALDEQSGLGLFYTGSNPLNLRSGYGSADFDVTHDVTFNYVYQFPDLVRSKGWLSKVANHWPCKGSPYLRVASHIAFTTIRAASRLLLLCDARLALGRLLKALSTAGRKTLKGPLHAG